MSARWTPGSFLALFMGATRIRRGYMITMLPVRGTIAVGDAIEMLWPGGDAILLEVAAIDIAAKYQPAAIEESPQELASLRRPVIVKDPDDERLMLDPGHILTVPEDEPHWPQDMRNRLRLAPAGVLLVEPGSLNHDKLIRLPPPDERTYHRLAQLVRQDVL